jgi:hypothetical protein
MTPLQESLALPFCICGDSRCGIPFGKCHCGCGRNVRLASQSHKKYRHIKGQPIMYLSGHSGSSRGKDRKPILFLKIDGNLVTFVPLPHGRYTIVDRGVENEFPGLWSYNSGYVTYFDPDTKKNKKLHRGIMGNPHGLKIDHRNGYTVDNRKENLRVVTQAQNSRNHKRHSTNTSGVSGVKWSKQEQKWISSITFERTCYFLGSFKIDEFDLAVKTRKDAEVKFFGEFARAE